jgi:predicted TIM-barrel fold metal-dependent hydrolase
MRKNVFHSFQEDALGIEFRKYIGVENLMWGSDYPHSESTFPKSREILEEILTGVPEDEKALIAGGNATKVYEFG